MRGEEAKEHCPEIELVHVPSVREKADLTKYREAGKQVAEVLQTFTELLERASIDEAYLDITDKVDEIYEELDKNQPNFDLESLTGTYAVGFDTIEDYVAQISSSNEFTTSQDIEDNLENPIVYKTSDLKLLIAAKIVNKIRLAVRETTGYACSAGIAHNKILAKLTCGFNKPNKQTCLPIKEIPKLLSSLPVNKVIGLGGKFGELVCEKLKVKFIGDILNYSENDLKRIFDVKNGLWLYLISHGIDLEKVTPRFFSKSIGCCKKFPGRNSIKEITTLNHWISQLALEISERLEKDEIENNRRPKQITVSYLQTIRGDDISSSRTVNLTDFNSENLAKEALEILKKNTETFFKAESQEQLNNPVKFLGISAGKFESILAPSTSKTNKIMELFGNHSKKNLNETEKVIVPVPEKSTSIKDLFKKLEEVEDKTSESRSFFKQILKNQASLENSDSKIEEPKSFFKTALKLKEDPEPSPIIPDEIEIGESSKPIEDYKKTYAEYLNIPKPNSTVFQTCELCEQEINEEEVDSHKDFHFALQLSQQQRTEFRNEIKNKTNVSTPLNKKRKIQTTNKSKPVKIRPIGNFLFKPKPKPAADTETEKCLDCERFIPIDGLIEHADYHAAKKLQIELNRESMVSQSCKPVKNTQSVASFFDKKIS